MCSIILVVVYGLKPQRFPGLFIVQKSYIHLRLLVNISRMVYLQQVSKTPQVAKYRQISFHHLFTSRSEPDETSARTGHCSTSWFPTARGAFDVAAEWSKGMSTKFSDPVFRFETSEKVR